MNEQKIEELKNKVKTAIDLFLANDGELLSLAGGIHEQTISHRIAVYLEPLFNGYHVDCEYNKHGDQKNDKKIIANITYSRQNCQCQSCKNRSSAKNSTNNASKKDIEIRPDIIIHKKRGDKRSGNILVIEVKKKGECSFDQAKLEALTLSDGKFKYMLGVFIWFTNDKPKYEWFVNGIKKI